LFNAGLFAGAFGIDALGLNTALMFNPPDAVVWGVELTLFLEIDPGESKRSHREEQEQYGREPDLEVF
jgi:hypothetical protein